MSKINLQTLGFSAKFAEEAASFGCFPVGRVSAQYKDLYRVITETGEVLAEVSGKLRFNAAALSDFPAVGDFVLLDRTDTVEGRAIIHHILRRKSAFIRKAAGTGNSEQVVASNIDTVFICMSLNSDFNLRRLERYLAIAWSSGALPIVTLTKADLCDDVAAKTAAAESVAIGAEILVTSSLADAGHEQILPHLKCGSTAAFIGSSGVGKSTLINRLAGTEFATNGLRNDDKGRHTTTRRELITLTNGALVIDFPGMPELIYPKALLISTNCPSNAVFVIVPIPTKQAVPFSKLSQTEYLPRTDWPAIKSCRRKYAMKALIPNRSNWKNSVPCSKILAV